MRLKYPQLYCVTLVSPSGMVLDSHRTGDHLETPDDDGDIILGSFFHSLCALIDAQLKPYIYDKNNKYMNNLNQRQDYMIQSISTNLQLILTHHFYNEYIVIFIFHFDDCQESYNEEVLKQHLKPLLSFLVRRINFNYCFFPGISFKDQLLGQYVRDLDKKLRGLH